MTDEDLDNLDIRLLADTASTNALALNALEEGASGGTVFVADCQSAGRGRRESGGDRRRWFSPPGKNLYFSVVARPDVAVEKSAAITLAVGVELIEWLRELTDVDVALKWPNDLYVGKRKVAGILTEGVTGKTGLLGLAIGVGLNVNVEADEFPQELRARATSLLEASGRRFDRLSLALAAPEAVLRACRRFGDSGLDAYFEKLQRFDHLRDRPLQIDDGGKQRGAKGRGIGPRGGLKVEFDNGEKRELVSGEVRISQW